MAEINEKKKGYIYSMDASTISKICKYFIARIDKVHKIFAPETDMPQQKSQNSPIY
jgi:hypothetical protein